MFKEVRNKTDIPVVSKGKHDDVWREIGVKKGRIPAYPLRKLLYFWATRV